MERRSYNKDYERFLSQFKWDYMVTIRKNYRTNENVVRNTSNKLIKQIDEIQTAVEGEFYKIVSRHAKRGILTFKKKR